VKLRSIELMEATMKVNPVLVLLAVLAVSSASGLEGTPPAAGPDKEVQAMLDGYGFPAYPNLKHFTGEEVAASSHEYLRWDGFSTTDPVPQVVEYYTKALGKEGLELDKDGAVWRFPADRPERVLDVRAVGAPGIHGSHRAEIPSDAKCVVIASRMSRPSSSRTAPTPP
jgi:hypothetical protein